MTARGEKIEKRLSNFSSSPAHVVQIVAGEG
jgi:hypothetical protein